MFWMFTYCSGLVQQTALRMLQAKHVTPQVSCENYVCLWVGCKVYARTSCSRSWLERHVLSHGGNKPFRCIVDGCGQRFSSQVGSSLYRLQTSQQGLHGFCWSRLCEFILYRNSEARVGVRLIEAEFVEDEMQGFGKCLKIMFFFFSLRHPASVLFNLSARDIVIQAGPWFRQFITGSVSCHPALSLWDLWWHRVKFFPSHPGFPITCSSTNASYCSAIRGWCSGPIWGHCTKQLPCPNHRVKRSYWYRTATNATGAQIPGVRVPGWMSF